MSTMMMNDFEQETSQAAPEGTYTGAVDVLKKLLKSEGPVALYKGCVPILLRCDNDHDNDDDGDHDNGYFDYLYLGCDFMMIIMFVTKLHCTVLIMFFKLAKNNFHL